MLAFGVSNVSLLSLLNCFLWHLRNQKQPWPGIIIVHTIYRHTLVVSPLNHLDQRYKAVVIALRKTLFSRLAGVVFVLSFYILFILSLRISALGFAKMKAYTFQRGHHLCCHHLQINKYRKYLNWFADLTKLI